MRCLSGTATRFILSVVAVAAFFAGSARAQFVWSNPAGGNWTVPANWGGTPPPAGGGAEVTLTFAPAGTYTATNDFPGPFTLNALNFTHASGTITIAPLGSSLNFINNAAAVGPSINMQGAGNAIISSPITLSNNTAVTTGAGGTGALTISGAITGAGNNLSYTGQSSLTLSGGGGMNRLSFQGGTGFITAGTYSLTSPTGAGNVDSGLQLGSATGQTTALTISGAGTAVNVSENIYIADANGASATLTVTNGAVVTNNAAGVVSGRLGVGNSGTGTLNVTNGGIVNTNLLFVSRLAGGSGTVLVDGPGSAINATVQLSFGTSSLGTGTIQNGGLATSGNTVNIGRAAGGVGTGVVTVTGSGSRLIAGFNTTTGTIAIGREGMGTLNVFNGAAAIANGGAAASPVIIGLTAGATGILDVQSGGTLTTTGGSFFASPVASTSTISVTGSGSLIDVTGAANAIILGGSGGVAGGPVTTTLSAGGTMRAANVVQLFGGATTNVNAGGTLSGGLFVDGTAGTSVGNIVTQAGGTVAITGIANTFATYSGVISGGGSVVATGVTDAGPQIFSGVNTYTGGTTLNSNGQLSVSGQINGPVVVNNGGVLSGGTATSAAGRILGNVTVNFGGTITGGSDPVTSPTGVLNITGPVAMTTLAFMGVGINGTTPGGGLAGHDQFDLTGGGSLAINNATLQTSLGYAPAPTDVITFVMGGPVTGTFAGRPNGTMFQVGTFSAVDYFATISYTANSVFLNNFTTVPEPVHMLGLGAAVFGGLGWWKKRRKAVVA